VEHPINVEVKASHFMTVWVVGHKVYCYIDKSRFPVDVQLEFVVFSLGREIQIVGDMVLFFC